MWGRYFAELAFDSTRAVDVCAGVVCLFGLAADAHALQFLLERADLGQERVLGASLLPLAVLVQLQPREPAFPARDTQRWGLPGEHKQARVLLLFGGTNASLFRVMCSRDYLRVARGEPPLQEPEQPNRRRETEEREIRHVRRPGGHSLHARFGTTPTHLSHKSLPSCPTRQKHPLQLGKRVHLPRLVSSVIISLSEALLLVGWLQIAGR